MTAAAALLVGCTSATDDGSGELVPELTLTYFSSDFGPTWEQSARVLAEDFEQLGIQVKLDPMEFTTFVDEIIINGNIEHMALSGLGGDPDRLDPNFWVVALAACEDARNAVHWCDEEYTKIAQEQSMTMDPEKREGLVHEAQMIFQDQAPWWHVTHENQGVVWNSDRWTNVTTSSPIPPYENTLHPWLEMRPTSDDRVLDWAHREDVGSYNVLTETASIGWLRMIYDPYLTYDQGELVPWAAESWTQIDDSSVELTLREGMTFHDGTPVTAADAVYTINTMVALQPPGFSDALRTIDGAEQIDNLTFVVQLNQPNPALFTQALTDLVIIPKHIWEGVSDPLQWNPIQDGGVIGSGPFTFGSWKPNQEHVLNVHEGHWAAPDYDGIRRLALGQADAVRTAMLDGTADFASDVLQASAMERLADENDHLDFMVIELFNSMMLWPNHEVEPLGDVEFRRALRLATNKERAALEGWLGFATPAAPGNVPIGLGHWHNGELESVGYDLDAARKVLTDAGYTWDSNDRLRMPSERG